MNQSGYSLFGQKYPDSPAQTPSFDISRFIESLKSDYFRSISDSRSNGGTDNGANSSDSNGPNWVYESKTTYNINQTRSFFAPIPSDGVSLSDIDANSNSHNHSVNIIPELATGSVDFSKYEQFVRNMLSDNESINQFNKGLDVRRLRVHGCHCHYVRWQEHIAHKGALLTFCRFSSCSVYLTLLTRFEMKKGTFDLQGAIESLLERSTKIQLCDGSVVELDHTSWNSILQSPHAMSSASLRCLGFAFKDDLSKFETDDGSEEHPTYKLLLDPSNYYSIKRGLTFLKATLARTVIPVFDDFILIFLPHRDPTLYHPVYNATTRSEFEWSNGVEETCQRGCNLTGSSFKSLSKVFDEFACRMEKIWRSEHETLSVVF